MPAHRPGHKRHELEPQTGLQCYRRRSPSAARWLRATELAGLGPTGRNAESNRSSTAASQPARASRALAPGRRPTSNSPNAFIRPQRLRRSRQIPIGQNLRSSSRGFVPWRLSDAGPGASGCACDGRHPKPYALRDIPDFGGTSLQPFLERSALGFVSKRTGSSQRSCRVAWAFGRGVRAAAEVCASLNIGLFRYACNLAIP